MSTPSSPVHHARSFLFVPATRPERFAKALDSAADCIVIDLEDAVAMDSKDAARDQLVQHLPLLTPEQRSRTVVRVNAVGTPWHDADIALLRDWAPQGVVVMLPKAEDADALRRVAQQLGDAARIVALIESLAGLDAADALARDPQVVRLAFGHLDFQLDLGMRASAEEPELAFARNALVAASRRARLPAPIDGVTVRTDDAERLAADARRARAFGFGGKLCIHPAQVAGVNEALGHSDEEQAWARRVIDEAAKHGGAVFNLDGRMVDLPVIRAAEAIVASVRK
ncbi:HpcH/HpaI aldolase/citrate lyase family protein [Burkholderia pseudomultivorans]|uniref:Citrate lyase subunit beta-like protein n=1 Tax=Burkholderia pseudomultivorans TaxID=1207504 RepID=A0ABU2E3E3_9BURK|nr:CoA ester lyase [Burkholderia pseudomultivorans]MDR8725991.1 Citrate lyase subunit beta-like protein [Burkholderia pseudomultivorans]MDR8735112.1 Citrate lyase subunit beta-like protein [Burkholderia pseudomultivorans]MDR8741067.1 Citrate lyase subunit beta-like protein [Burkholderia pseudomultivorans]MDR8754382.1 Citrate lyase subunit beta-like protein [Burkholderia pseudomultivorans]MDR8777492.1 Citrate lyase subunit beta-like protein [Burkholderia pseudomultivorans]